MFIWNLQSTSRVKLVQVQLIWKNSCSRGIQKRFCHDDIREVKIDRFANTSLMFYSTTIRDGQGRGGVLNSITYEQYILKGEKRHGLRTYEDLIDMLFREIQSANKLIGTLECTGFMSMERWDFMLK